MRLNKPFRRSLKPAYPARRLNSELQNRLLASQDFPRSHSFLSQKSWLYDIRRFAGTRLSLLGFCNALNAHLNALERQFPDRPATGHRHR